MCNKIVRCIFCHDNFTHICFHGTQRDLLYVLNGKCCYYLYDSFCWKLKLRYTILMRGLFIMMGEKSRKKYCAAPSRKEKKPYIMRHVSAGQNSALFINREINLAITYYSIPGDL